MAKGAERSPFFCDCKFKNNDFARNKQKTKNKFCLQKIDKWTKFIYNSNCKKCERVKYEN